MTGQVRGPAWETCRRVTDLTVLGGIHPNTFELSPTFSLEPMCYRCAGIRTLNLLHKGRGMALTMPREAMGKRFAEAVRRHVGARNYDHWFSEVEYGVRPGSSEQTLTVTAPNRFAADTIRRRFRDELVSAAGDAGGEIRVEVCAGEVTRRGGRVSSEPKRAEGEKRAAAVAPKRRGSKMRYGLGDYVVGASNELAYGAAMQVAEGKAGFDLLFVHGGCGLGKTHLIQGLCRRFASSQPGRRWRFTTAEQFTNQYIVAVREHRLPAFRAGLRKLDLLVVDDVHFLSRKTATQSEFLHTFDSIVGHGAKIVMVSDNHPKLIADFNAALVSRFVSGMVAEIGVPDASMRRRLVCALAARLGMELSEASVVSLVERCRGSVREIEGALTTLGAMRELRGPGADDDRATIGMALTHRLTERAAVGPVRPIRYEQVAGVVQRRLGVTTEQMAGKGRSKKVVLARGLTAYLTRKLTTLSYPEIARAMGRTSHSTIVAAKQRIEQQIADGEMVDLGEGAGAVRLDDLAEALRGGVFAEVGASAA